MSAKKYVKSSIAKLEVTLTKRDMQLSTSHFRMPTNYHPSEDVNNELSAQGLQAYQELVCEYLWAAEIGRVDILLEVSLLSSHLALQQSGYLQGVYQIFGYLKQVPKQ